MRPGAHAALSGGMPKFSICAAIVFFMTLFFFTENVPKRFRFSEIIRMMHNGRRYFEQGPSGFVCQMPGSNDWNINDNYKRKRGWYYLPSFFSASTLLFFHPTNKRGWCYCDRQRNEVKWQTLELFLPRSGTSGSDFSNV